MLQLSKEQLQMDEAANVAMDVQSKWVALAFHRWCLKQGWEWDERLERWVGNGFRFTHERMFLAFELSCRDECDKVVKDI